MKWASLGLGYFYILVAWLTAALATVPIYQEKGMTPTAKQVEYTINNRTPNEPPVELACKELARYLHHMTGGSFAVTTGNASAPIQVGTFDCFPELGNAQELAVSEEDEIYISSFQNRLAITGSNPRSTLFAAYTLLRELGARWLEPGEEGERIPTGVRLSLRGWNLRHRPSLRHRGYATEGAFTPEQQIAFVDWMAKNRMNHFFWQFRSLALFYHRAGVALTEEEVRAADHRVLEAIRQRGLILEAVGHGWINEALGRPVEGWVKVDEPPSIQISPLLAQLRGERTWWNRMPLSTQLCLSNPEGKRRVTEYVLDFARQHPEVDILAFWLADGFNNWCECDQCRSLHPSDAYVRWVNELAPLLHEVAPRMKLEIIAYTSLMAPPPTERIKNSDNNVVMMLAPYARCYEHGLWDPKCRMSHPLTDWPRLNQLEWPKNVEYSAFLEGWRQAFLRAPDTYVFDYFDPGNGNWDVLRANLPRTLFEDLQGLHERGFGGIVNCQSPLAFWPTGLTMFLLAEASWDIRRSFQAIRRDFLSHAYGNQWQAVARYLDDLYAAMIELGRYDHSSIARLGKRPEVEKQLDKLHSRLLRIQDASQGPIVKSRLHRLLEQIQVIQATVRALRLRASCDEEAAEEALSRLLNLNEQSRDRTEANYLHNYARSVYWKIRQFIRHGTEDD